MRKDCCSKFGLEIPTYITGFFLFYRVQSVTEGNREDPTTMERDKKIKMQSPSKDSSIPNGYSTMESLNHNGYTSIDHLKEPQQSSLVQGPSPLPPPQHLNGYTSSLNAMIQTKPPEPDSYFQSQDGGFGSGYSKHFSQLKMSESDCCVSVEQVKKKNNNNAMSFVVQKDRQQQQLLCQPGNGGEGVL